MTTKPLQDIIEGKVRQLESSGEWRFVSSKMRVKLGDVAIDDCLDAIRDALREVIIEGIEAVLPEELSVYEEAPQDAIKLNEALAQGHNGCRAQILQSLQALKKQS